MRIRYAFVEGRATIVMHDFRTLQVVLLTVLSLDHVIYTLFVWFVTAGDVGSVTPSQICSVLNFDPCKLCRSCIAC